MDLFFLIQRFFVSIRCFASVHQGFDRQTCAVVQTQIFGFCLFILFYELLSTDNLCDARKTELDFDSIVHFLLLSSSGSRGELEPSQLYDSIIMLSMVYLNCRCIMSTFHHCEHWHGNSVCVQYRCEKTVGQLAVEEKPYPGNILHYNNVSSSVFSRTFIALLHPVLTVCLMGLMLLSNNMKPLIQLITQRKELCLGSDPSLRFILCILVTVMIWQSGVLQNV